MVLRPNKRGLPGIMVCRMLVFIGPFGPLIQVPQTLVPLWSFAVIPQTHAIDPDWLVANACCILIARLTRGVRNTGRPATSAFTETQREKVPNHLQSCIIHLEFLSLLSKLQLAIASSPDSESPARLLPSSKGSANDAAEVGEHLVLFGVPIEAGCCGWGNGKETRGVQNGWEL